MMALCVSSVEQSFCHKCKGKCLLIPTRDKSVQIINPHLKTAAEGKQPPTKVGTCCAHHATGLPVAAGDFSDKASHNASVTADELSGCCSSCRSQKRYLPHHVWSPAKYDSA